MYVHIKVVTYVTFPNKQDLLHCPRYENQRLKMLNSFRIILTDTQVLTKTTDLLLSGSEHLSVDKNTRFFDAVFKVHQ